MDDDGFIFLGYEAAEINDESKFLWSKNYSEPIDSGRAQAETKTNRCGWSLAKWTVCLYLFELQEICGGLHENVRKLHLSQGLCACHTSSAISCWFSSDPKKCCLPCNIIVIWCKHRDYINIRCGLGFLNLLCNATSIEYFSGLFELFLLIAWGRICTVPLSDSM